MFTEREGMSNMLGSVASANVYNSVPNGNFFQVMHCSEN